MMTCISFGLLALISSQVSLATTLHPPSTNSHSKRTIDDIRQLGRNIFEPGARDDPNESNRSVFTSTHETLARDYRAATLMGSDEVSPVVRETQDHNVTVCRCDVINACITGPAFAQRNELFLCLTIHSDSMEFIDIEYLSFTQNSFVVEAITEGSKDKFTWVLKRDNACTIRTRLIPTRFFKPTFLGKPRSNVIVNGAALISKKIEGANHSHTIFLDAPKAASFRMEIPVESTRLFAFLRGYSAVTWYVLLLFLSLIFFVFTMYELKCAKRRKKVRQDRKGSFPTNPDRNVPSTDNIPPNAEEIARIFFESGRYKVVTPQEESIV